MLNFKYRVDVMGLDRMTVFVKVEDTENKYNNRTLGLKDFPRLHRELPEDFAKRVAEEAKKYRDEIAFLQSKVEYYS